MSRRRANSDLSLVLLLPHGDGLWHWFTRLNLVCTRYLGCRPTLSYVSMAVPAQRFYCISPPSPIPSCRKLLNPPTLQSHSVRGASRPSTGVVPFLSLKSWARALKTSARCCENGPGACFSSISSPLSSAHSARVWYHASSASAGSRSSPRLAVGLDCGL